MEASLARVRAQKASKIPVQARQVALLEAVESALHEDGQKVTAPALFASLVGLLDRDAAAPAAGLLALVVPHVSQALLVSKLDVVVARLAPILVDADADTALVRACIGVLEAVLEAAEPAVWHTIPLDEPGPLRTFAGVLALAQDGRPKIRRRALEAIPRILGTHNRHPGSELALQSALEAVQAASSDTARVVHGLQLLRAVVTCVEMDSEHKFGAVASTLIAVIRSSDQYVVLAALEVFDAVFTNQTTTPTALERSISLLAEITPSPADKQLVPSWCAVIAQAYAALASLEPAKALAGLSNMLDVMNPYLASGAAREVSESASQCLCALFTSGMTPHVLIKEPQVLVPLAEKLFGLLHTRFHGSWDSICNIIATFLDRAHYLSSQVHSRITDIVTVVGALRPTPQLRAGCDLILAAAIRNVGPERVCELVPLQLSSEGGGRAWMLPLLRDNVQHAHLAHFVAEFLPLAQQFEDAAGRIKNPKHAKIVATVSDQIWALWPRYCDLPKDLPQSLNHDLVGLILSRLYDHPHQRPGLCQGLRLLVESNLVYSETSPADEDPILAADFAPKAAERSLRYVATKFGSDILKALLNVFSTMTPETRGYMLDTINAYLAALEPAQVEELFHQVSSVLATSLTAGSQNIAGAQTMMDVVVAIVAYLPASQHPTFLNLFRTVVAMPDQLLQKKAYRSLTRLLDTHPDANVSGVTSLVVGLAESALPAARRTRLGALSSLLASVADAELGAYVFSVLPEAILATRDPNEKSRDAAFSLVVALGHRMASGTGVIDHAQIAAFDDDASVPATLREYFEMLMGGLVGTTPHMIAATVTTLSRVLYEFRSELEIEKQAEYADLVWMLLQSPSREIVGAVLGFVKVTILVLPVNLLVPRLRQLLEGLLEWSNEHKNAFKAKVRHIVERLVRRVGYDEVAATFPHDHLKLLQNIQKSKERAKRKQSTNASVPEDAQNAPRERRFDNEFDEALYGSESESDSDSGSEDDANPATRKSAPQKGSHQKKNNAQRHDQYIVTSNEPLDLLDEGALAHISSSKPGPAPRKHIKNRLPQKDGKFVIRDDDDTNAAVDAGLDEKEALQAYVEAVKSGPVRTQSGKLKFRRGKRGHDEDDDEGADANLKGSKVAKQSRGFKGARKAKQRPQRRGL